MLPQHMHTNTSYIRVTLFQASLLPPKVSHVPLVVNNATVITCGASPLVTVHHPLSFFRSTTKDSGGLLAAGLAGATSYYCHGNQCEGRESYQVSAVLARQWQEGIWTFPSDHN